jgi:hypothetical protein
MSDIHIRKTPNRNEEYQSVFKRTIESIKLKKPDRIVIVGDLVNDYLDLQGEQLILAHEFLRELSKIAPVRITRGNHDCFTGDHEILTKEGWTTLKNYVDSNCNLEVLTFNPNNEHFEFQLPSEKIKKTFNGNLKQFKTDKCEFITTPSHEILLYQYSNNNYVKKYANFVDLNKDYRIPLRSREIINDFDKWFEFLGFCLADATFVIKNQNTMNGRVQFHFKKERKINYLCKLLDELNIPYKLRDGDRKRNTKVICVYSQPARNVMKFFNYNKKLSYDMGLMNYSKYKLKSFIDGYLNGDGSLIENNRYGCVSIFNENAEILTTISNYVGYSGYVQDSNIFGNYKNSKRQYSFFIIKNNDLKTTQINEINDIPYNGNVYCLTVPNENLFVRYEGRPFITGNCRKKNLKRVDSVKAIVETLSDYDINYYDKTGFYDDDNITWAVWHHGDAKNNPWKTKTGKSILANPEQYFTIDLFHDPISGCRSTTDFEMKSRSYYNINDFNGNLSFFGDIHNAQFLDSKQTKGYCGSLIEQDITEGDGAFHGYFLWDVEKLTAELVPIKNDYTHHNIKITPYTDFDDLDFEIENPTTFMKVRFIWGTLPQTRSKENERRVVEYIRSKHKNVTILHKNDFIESEEIEVSENINLENIVDDAVQQEIFKEFLTKIGTDEQMINDVLALDEEVLKEINIETETSVEWNVIKFGGTNFMSYANLDIDWRDMDGLFQICGINTAGKTTILKIISYALFGKTLETETRVKHGDIRFINNRNNANHCDTYLVIEANDEYYGIKRKTTIERMKDGSIKSVPTVLNYYLLASPDDEMNDNNVLEKLDEDKRIKTQGSINSIIGSYDNFMRIVMTTSDTLNRILSNDMAVFIDSLLFDSGLDIFDKKLEGWKVINKRNNEKSRVNCNIEQTSNQNANLRHEIANLQTEISDIETIKIPDVQQRIANGREFVENLTKKLYEIDNEIYNLDVDATKETIENHNKTINNHNERIKILQSSIVVLKDNYDVIRFNELIEKRDDHKQEVNDKKIQIKEEERNKSDYQHQIEIINGKLFTLKRDGLSKKEEIKRLKESKICPTCGQPLTDEHQEHININIKTIEDLMFGIADEIKLLQKDIETGWIPLIKTCDDNIQNINNEIVNLGLDMENVLKEIGKITNDKNEVDSRKQYQIELDSIPTKIQNEELKIEILKSKLTNYDNCLKQIESNHKVDHGIVVAKERLISLENEFNGLKEDVYVRKTSVGDKLIKIKNNEILINEFKLQEYQDTVMNLYKKCVHRDGIPKQMLVNYIIPKINNTLQQILSVAPFKVWLDSDDLRPKLVYNNRPASIIDCIGASGKERTFSSVVLKFALNQINVKAKPTIFLLDEVMGKLDSEGSVDEFIEILQMIKLKMKKVLIIEHHAELNPDYMINVNLDDDGISNINII